MTVSLRKSMRFMAKGPLPLMGDSLRDDPGLFASITPVMPDSNVGELFVRLCPAAYAMNSAVCGIAAADFLRRHRRKKRNPANVEKTMAKPASVCTLGSSQSTSGSFRP